MSLQNTEVHVLRKLSASFSFLMKFSNEHVTCIRCLLVFIIHRRGCTDNMTT